MTQKLETKPGLVGATMVTNSGVYFDFLDPDPDTIWPSDIAHGLAKTARFGGQTRDFYSVAQHSVLVSQIVPEEHAFAALLHDAPEAYIGDMVGPLKQLLPEYKTIEKRVEAAIAERFGLPVDAFSHPEIKTADLRLLRTEQRDQTTRPDDDWSGLDKFEPLPLPIIALPWRAAFEQFVFRYLELRS
ncbi:MAG: HD domain-containing protein [Henriciella sp.]|nr:HD domain-containing protein [Henriciella sp.]